MSIRVSTTATPTSRPRCIVSHIDQPSYSSTLRNYKHIAATFPPQACGLWVLQDVHIVDHNVCLTMAWLRQLWRLGRTHLLLVAPSLEASRQWARYISGSSPACQGPQRSLFPRPEVLYMPSLSAASLVNWLHQQTLEGDVLVFAGSNCQRDQLAMALRACSLEPVYVVKTSLPLRIRKAPRVLVGGDSLDGLILSSCDALVDGVQHVVDFGVCARIRSDTGNDWEPVPITIAMALGRRSVVGRRGRGVCLAAYENDDWLSRSPFATHLLRKGVCQAKLRSRFRGDVLHDFPIDLGPCPSNQEATIMTLLDVERPVARMVLSSASPEAGIGLAAVVAREEAAGPFPKHPYEKLQEGLASKELTAIIYRWARGLGTAPQRVLKAVRVTPWQQAVTAVAQAYRHTTAVNTGARRLFVDVASGDLLRCKFSHTAMPAVAYTHRYKADIVAYVPLPSSPVELRQASVRVEGDPKPAEAWFECRSVVAIHRRATGELKLVCGQQVDLDAILAQWTAMNLSKLRHAPLPVPVGPSMHIIFSAGLQLTDVVHDDDTVLIECGASSTHDLSRIHEMPAVRVRGNTLLLPSRDEVRKLCQTLSQVTGVNARSLRPDLPRLRAELVIRTYLGRSTGRVTIRGAGDDAWQDRVRASWGWTVVQSRIHHVAPSLDEFDVADMLGVDPFRVTVERSTNIVAQLACVHDLLSELSVPVTTHRTLRTNDAVVRLEANTAEHIIRGVMDALPSRNDAVDQPLRIFWIVRVQSLSGSRPTTHGVIRQASPGAASVRQAIQLAEAQLTAALPDVLWIPSLAGLSVSLPHANNNVQRDGSRFLVYGSSSERQAARRSLRILQQRKATAPDDTHVCSICFDSPAGFTLRLCGCRACIGCVSTTFEMKCRDTSFRGLLECPFCHAPATAEDIRATVSELGLRTHALKMAGFLSKQNPRLIQECPAPGCGFFGRLSSSENKTLACPLCMQCWCITCTEASGVLQQAHKGFCLEKRDVAFWRTYAEEAKEAGAKPCPSCNTFVVKDEGCNHMTCVAPSCNTHFCWKCGLAFSHVQSSPRALGIIETIDDERAVVAVDASSWNPPCMTPCPKTVTCARHFVSDMLLRGGQTVEVGASVHVHAYIYDHIDACAGD